MERFLLEEHGQEEDDTWIMTWRAMDTVKTEQHHVDDEDGAALISRPSAMTVTIAVDDGPTVRLTYAGGWLHGPIVPCTSLEVRDQPRTPAPRWLYDLLAQAGALLIWYDVAEKDWPPRATDG